MKLDFILNHASVLSKQFQDIIAKGEESEYKDFFINWNEFWKDCGEMTEQGYILPEEKYLKKMFSGSLGSHSYGTFSGWERDPLLEYFLSGSELP